MSLATANLNSTTGSLATAFSFDLPVQLYSYDLQVLACTNMASPKSVFIAMCIKDVGSEGAR